MCRTLYIVCACVYICNFFFLEREMGRDKEIGRNINVWLPLTCHPLKIWPATQTCALIGNQPSDPLVCRLALNPLSLTSQGKSWIYNPPTHPSIIHSFSHNSSIHLFIVHLSIYVCIHPFIHLSIHTPIHSYFTHPFIHYPSTHNPTIHAFI